jgi:predicted flap endonuclease-1-like 5' DNA nuclease
VKIRYVGPGAGGVTIRLIGAFRWAPDTGYVQDVGAEMAASLLTQPETEFVIDSSETLTALHDVGPQRAAEMALAGIGSVADLAALDEDGIARLAKGMFASERQVKAWVGQAKRMTAEGG